MAKERLKSPRARLFIALELPEEVRARIVRWQGRELADPALRAIPSKSLHMTLAFLGYRPERDVERLRAILAAAGGAAPRIELLGPVPRPERGRARLFALGARSPEAISLQGALEERLVGERLYEPEARPFWPHVTVARVRPEGRGSKRPMGVESEPGALPEALLEPFFAVRLTLYRSQLRRQGALYTPLVQVELSPDGRQ